MKKILSGFLVLVIMITLSACSRDKEEKFSNSFFAFDTYIQLDGYTNTKEEFDKYYEQAQSEFKKYHELFDAYNNYPKINNIKTINDNAGKKPVKIDAQIYEVLKRSKEEYNKLYKKNNILLAPIIQEYKKVTEDYNNGKKVSHPDMNKLKKINKCTSMSYLELLDNNEVYLTKSCAMLDVGSVAKGYTTDLVAQDLEKAGLKSGILNAGGNVAVIGEKPGGKPFKVGIADPFASSDYVAIVDAKSTNVVTSGDYQRYYEIDGVKYNHIIDPDTLRPADKYLSVSIVIKDGFLADYLTTELFMLDEKTIEKISKDYDFEYIIIHKDSKITYSEGLKNEISIK